MVKIGRTRGPSEERAAQLSRASGVPDKFMVVYDELVSDCNLVERLVHERLRETRTNTRREFFEIQVKTAIRVLHAEASPYLIAASDGDRVEVTGDLAQRFGVWLKPDIRSISLVQLEGLCLLEVFRATGPDTDLADSTSLTERFDLSFIVDVRDDGTQCEYFRPEDPIATNANKLVALDDESFFQTMPIFAEWSYPEAQSFNDDGFDTRELPPSNFGDS